MKTLLTLSLAAAALALTSAPAFAQSDAASQRLVVSYADLDLSTRQGVRTLDRRLRAAASTACGPTSDFDPEGKNDARHCRAETLAEARAQRDSAIAGLTRSPQIEIASRR
jgi:UrcA family protein